jgi:predicted DNA-binding protein
MVRTQIQLTDEQAERLKRIAAARGMSLAAVIREAVDAVVQDGDADAARPERALAVVGRFGSGRHDVSTEHDRELADAFGA